MTTLFHPHLSPASLMAMSDCVLDLLKSVTQQIKRTRLPKTAIYWTSCVQFRNVLKVSLSFAQSEVEPIAKSSQSLPVPLRHSAARSKDEELSQWEKPLFRSLSVSKHKNAPALHANVASKGTFMRLPHRTMRQFAPTGDWSITTWATCNL